ncbi:MAG: amidohydrolase [Gammaproteobacteria bacterium]|nr:MAG: amidohydrolase [Gammaproteobacteria bacterium]
MKTLYSFLIFILFTSLPVFASSEYFVEAIDQESDALLKKITTWRQHLHKYPELSNREFKTAKYIEQHLRSLGLDVKTGIAKTGLVAMLKGDKPGPLVALRADMDALPVVEQTGLPFASTEKTTFNGLDVGVMHACGHDAHMAILMGVAEFFTKHKTELAGSIMFIFQPAEEGPPVGEEGGAKLMLKEGIFKENKPDVVFGLHVNPAPDGVIAYREGPTMAAADSWKIIVTGKQAHGSAPWAGVDPIMISSQIVSAFNTIVSRKLDIRNLPAVISVGSVHGGVRSNIIPNEVVMEGTVRTYDPKMREKIITEMTTLAKSTAEMNGGSAEVIIPNGSNYPVTINDPDLTARVLPILKNVVASKEYLVRTDRSTGAEDFSYYAQEVPGFFFFLGVTEQGKDWTKVAGNHSPYFEVSDASLDTGVKAFVHLTSGFLFQEY